jgi:hemerythrin-like domain-containing protein
MLQERPDLIVRLGDDHQRIASVVDEFAACSATEKPDWQRLSELVGFLEFFADRIHHPLEDRLFDRLMDKGLTPSERRLIFKNLREHQEISTLTETMTREIDLALAGGVVDLSEFQGLADQYLSLQRRHMRFEESYLFPMLEAVFDQRDWGAIKGILEPNLVESN